MFRKILPPQVELLVMRALSRGLVRGSIDQVEQRVQIQWVRPRVLDREQVIVTLCDLIEKITSFSNSP